MRFCVCVFFRSRRRSSTSTTLAVIEVVNVVEVRAVMQRNGGGSSSRSGSSSKVEVRAGDGNERWQLRLTGSCMSAVAIGWSRSSSTVAGSSL